MAVQGLLSGPDDIIPPENSTIPTGKSAVPWSPSRWGPDATIDPSQFAGAGGVPSWLTALLGKGGLYGLGGYLMGKIIEPQSAGGDLPLSLSGARPEHPHSTGAMPPPFVQPAHPSTMRYPMWPTPPAPVTDAPAPVATQPPATAPLPPPRPAAPQPRINPAQVDLGYYRAGVGNARTPTFVPQGQTVAPSIFRGPLALGAGRDYYGS